MAETIVSMLAVFSMLFQGLPVLGLLPSRTPR